MSAINLTDFQTKTKFFECAVCKRITSEAHGEEYYDFWICCWCGN